MRMRIKGGTRKYKGNNINPHCAEGSQSTEVYGDLYHCQIFCQFYNYDILDCNQSNQPNQFTQSNQSHQSNQSNQSNLIKLINLTNPVNLINIINQ